MLVVSSHLVYTNSYKYQCSIGDDTSRWNGTKAMQDDIVWNFTYLSSRTSLTKGNIIKKKKKNHICLTSFFIVGQNLIMIIPLLMLKCGWILFNLGTLFGCSDLVIVTSM
jgi:hypothetical protein